MANRRLERGDVYIVHCPLPDREAGTGVRATHKWVALLHGEDTYPNSSDITVLVISTWRRDDALPAAYEVILDRSHGMQNKSVLDGRWPLLMLKRDVHRGTYKCSLTLPAMDEIAEAVMVGLCL